MAEQAIRIGVVGAGGIFEQRHLPNLQPMDDVAFVAVCNRRRESSEQVKEQWGFADIETNWEKLVARDEINAVFIGTWPYLHKDVTLAALNAGKHVFCQARMTNDWADAVTMYEAARHHPDRVTMICPPPHRMPWEPYIRKLIESDELGELRDVRVVSVNASNADPNQITWREQIEYSGLQALQVGIWAETLNAWVGEYRRLSATLATPLAHKTAADGSTYTIQIPQIVLVDGELTNGAVIGEHHSGLSLSEKANRVTIYGSKGTLAVDVMNRIRFAKPGEELAPVDVPASEQRDWRVELDFVEAVRAADRGEPWSVDPDFEAGLRYMRKVQAIHDAARRGARVELAEQYPIPPASS